MRQHLVRLLKWTAALATLGGLLALAYVVREHNRPGEDADAEPPKRAANKVIKLGAAFAESHGIRDEPAQSASWTKRSAAYGRVVVNPRSVAEVRAASAGTLRADPKDGWPALGGRVKAGQVLGWLDVRVGPQERLDLLTKLNEARLKQKGAEELVRLQKERYDRLKGAGGGVSQSELDTAETQLTEARTQLETAKAGVQGWQQALDAIDGQGESKGKTWSQPLTAPSAGEVTELTGRPGMAVEPGGVVARLVDFRFALVRLEVPPEALTEGPPATADLFPAAPLPPALQGASNRPEAAGPARTLKGKLVGTAPQVEASSQFAAYWYEADTAPSESGEKPGAGAGGLWRPGLAVKAFVKVPDAKPQPAVSVPETALLYHDGRALVYVRIGPGRYERREVQVLGREDSRWVLSGGVAPGEPVVSQRAQVLLSEEFRGEADID